jgi:hypothetical protein
VTDDVYPLVVSIYTHKHSDEEHVLPIPNYERVDSELRACRFRITSSMHSCLCAHMWVHRYMSDSKVSIVHNMYVRA